MNFFSTTFRLWRKDSGSAPTRLANGYPSAPIYLFVTICLFLLCLGVADGVAADRTNRVEAAKLATSIQWVHEGESLLREAMKHSITNRNITIGIFVDQSRASKAVGAAKKIQAKLNEAHVTSQIVVKMIENEGVGYIYYADGWAVYETPEGKKSVFSPKEAARMLPRVVATLNASLKLEPGGAGRQLKAQD